ncbi:MAG: hypothetical protein LBE82_07180 [Chitinophagaceae bacterium]|jgi:ABC-type cobalamin/Fe3+-siderophores transport system ATPase subunit|nr:hypothetical protein [Chitinophagaceae bacterium]
MSETPLQFYKNRIAFLKNELAKLTSVKRNIGWLRFSVVLATAVILYFSWNGTILVPILFLLAGIAAFLFCVSKDINNNHAIEDTQRLIEINEDEIRIMHHEFSHRQNGNEFIDPNHAYTNDLDIFGNNSLYQLINRCTSEQGKKLLAQRLSSYSAQKEIVEMQQAVKELSAKPVWMQSMQSAGMQCPITFQAEKNIHQWLQEPFIFTEKIWTILIWIFPVITLGSFYCYLDDIISGTIFSMILLACFSFAFSLSKKIQATWIMLSKIVNEADTLYRQLVLPETENFSAPYLQRIKQSAGNKASAGNLKLKRILGMFDVRANVFAFPILNTFFLWDLRQMLALNKWKKQYHPAVASWFSVIAEIEFLNSLATLFFHKSDWCFPEIREDYFTLSGTDIGHPLIREDKCVSNSFSINGTGQIALITGSNMAGKSTFLRCLGVNMVLALAGAPVCAKAFSVSVSKLMSSMRIADNLAENTSTFYAELKKLQSIIEAVNKKENVFILLDEILRGTNSLDRHTGSKALVQQLIKQQSVAVLATHDIELASIESAYPQALHNYHFDVQVDKNDELYFDYKLKTGICQSLNASILMKKIGISINNE